MHFLHLCTEPHQLIPCRASTVQPCPTTTRTCAGVNSIHCTSQLGCINSTGVFMPVKCHQMSQTWLTFMHIKVSMCVGYTVCVFTVCLWVCLEKFSRDRTVSAVDLQTMRARSQLLRITIMFFYGTWLQSDSVIILNMYIKLQVG